MWSNRAVGERPKLTVRAQREAAAQAEARRAETLAYELEATSGFAPIPAKAQGVRHKAPPRHYTVLRLAKGYVNGPSEIKLLFQRGQLFLTDPGDQPINLADFVEGTIVLLRYGRNLSLVVAHKV